MALSTARKSVAPGRTRDSVVDDLIEKLTEHRRVLAAYRASMFARPRREEDAATLARAERRLDEAISRLRAWQAVQPTRWRNKAALL